MAPVGLLGRPLKVVQQVLGTTGVPSASVAVVEDGRLTYAGATGLADIASGTAATPQMRYDIGSISKQFTAAAILLLVERHQVSLDDPVTRFLPTLNKEVSVRQVLSHTSGYQDFWPQDYVPPYMRTPTTPSEILRHWHILDFEPGHGWEYSNTNYVIAGRIVEQVSAKPLLEFLAENIFRPLRMTSVSSEPDVVGYSCFALASPRPAPPVGHGWMFGACELAMTADDLARWDISMMNQSLLQPESYRTMETEVAHGYALGLTVRRRDGHRVIEHSGETSGFEADNVVLPDERRAVVVLCNQDATSAPDVIAHRLLGWDQRSPRLAHRDPSPREQTVWSCFRALQSGHIDRSRFTPDAISYFTDQALSDYASSLGPLGSPSNCVETGSIARGGLTYHAYRITCGSTDLEVSTYETHDGHLEQFEVARIP